MSPFMMYCLVMMGVYQTNIDASMKAIKERQSVALQEDSGGLEMKGRVLHWTRARCFTHLSQAPIHPPPSGSAETAISSAEPQSPPKWLSFSFYPTETYNVLSMG